MAHIRVYADQKGGGCAVLRAESLRVFDFFRTWFEPVKRENFQRRWSIDRLCEFKCHSIHTVLVLCQDAWRFKVWLLLFYLLYLLDFVGFLVTPSVIASRVTRFWWEIIRISTLSMPVPLLIMPWPTSMVRPSFRHFSFNLSISE